MATLPTSTHLGDDARVKTEAKVDIVAVRDVVAQIGGSERWATDKVLTIASGVITPTMALHQVETQGGASSDDLTNIAVTNLPEGSFLRLRPSIGGHTVVFKHLTGGTGQMYLATDVDFTADAADKFIDFVREGNYWFEVNRCWGADKTSLAFRTFYSMGTAAALDYGTSANQLVRLNSSAQIPGVSGALITGIERRGQYILVEDQKSAMTDGGSFSLLNWYRRDLNTKCVDETVNAVVTVSSNMVNLPAGTYYFRASAPGYSVAEHKIQVRQSTGASIFYGPSGMIAQVYGSAEYAPTYVTTRSEACGKFILAAAGSIEVQHTCNAAQSVTGYGNALGRGTEVYTRIEFWRVP